MHTRQSKKYKVYDEARIQYKQQLTVTITILKTVCKAGADPGFQVWGADLKKSRRAERGAKICGVFRVKNHDFTQKKSYFFQF